MGAEESTATGKKSSSTKEAKRGLSLDLYLQKPEDVSEHTYEEHDDDDELVSLDATLAAITPRKQSQQQQQPALITPTSTSTVHHHEVVQQPPPPEARSDVDHHHHHPAADEPDAALQKPQPQPQRSCETTAEHSANPKGPTQAAAVAVVVVSPAGETRDDCTTNKAKNTTAAAAAAISLPPADLFEDGDSSASGSSVVKSPNASFDKDELSHPAISSTDNGKQPPDGVTESPRVRDAATTANDSNCGAVELLSTEENNGPTNLLLSAPGQPNPGGAAEAAISTSTCIENNSNDNVLTNMGDTESKCCPRSIPAYVVADKEDDDDHHPSVTKEESSTTTGEQHSDAVVLTAESAELRDQAEGDSREEEDEKKQEEDDKPTADADADAATTDGAAVDIPPAAANETELEEGAAPAGDKHDETAGASRVVANDSSDETREETKVVAAEKFVAASSEEKVLSIKVTDKVQETDQAPLEGASEVVDNSAALQGEDEANESTQPDKTENIERESASKSNVESEEAPPLQNSLSGDKSNDESGKDKAAIDSIKQKEEPLEGASTSGSLEAKATDHAGLSKPDEGSESIKPQEISKVETEEPEKPEKQAAAVESEEATTSANGVAQTVSMDTGDWEPSKTNSSEETKQAVGGMSKETASALESSELRPAVMERVSSAETKQATGAKESETETAGKPNDIGPLPSKTALPATETPKSPTNTNGKPPLKPSEVADDESTLASTFTGFGGPVSYVEFSNSNTNKDRLAAAGSVVREVKVKPVFEPDDTRLASVPKLLVADLWNDDESKVKAALEHMGRLCAKPENITEILSHGGHMSLTLVLRKWSSSAEVQAAGLDTLYKAAESLDFCNAVVRLGALELAVIAMKNHPNSEDVLTAGCAALLNLTLPADVARQLVCEMSGIQIVAKACATFPQNVALQKYALWLIQYMSYWEDFKEPIVKGGGLQILTKIVETFSTSTEKNADTILKSARSTIQRLL